MPRPKKNPESSFVPVSPFGPPASSPTGAEILAAEEKAAKKEKAVEFSPEVLDKNRQKIERLETDAEVSKRLKEKKKQYEELKKIFE